jgi:hypothetical protein
MPIGKYNHSQRQIVNTTARSFHRVSGVTINGGVHTAVSGIKMIIDSDANMEDVQRARELLRDGSRREANLLSGAKDVVLNGANTESIGGGSIRITGDRKNR